ncbi:MAG: hypothetical protein JRI34_02725 [Deltaproteobacteria bacterium]|nr:hypothetical protein [Deltaproteobacteria bacterium]
MSCKLGSFPCKARNGYLICASVLVAYFMRCRCGTGLIIFVIVYHLRFPVTSGFVTGGGVV